MGRKSNRTTIRPRSSHLTYTLSSFQELLGPTFHEDSLQQSLQEPYLTHKKAKSYANAYFSTETHQGTQHDPANSNTINKTTTNATLDENHLHSSLLVDTGFSGQGVVGDHNLALARRRWPSRFRRTLRAPSKPTQFIFGSGAPVIARRKVMLNHPLLGDVEIDVVPGRLPFLIGRRLLKRARISIDFDKNIIESAASNLRQSGTAYLISLQDTEKLVKRIGASGKSTSPSPTGSDDARSAAQCQTVSVSSGGDKILSSATADGGIASAASGQERAAPAPMSRLRAVGI